MNHHLPGLVRVNEGQVGPDGRLVPAVNLLLVSRSQAWKQAVRGATHGSGSGVLACTAHEALTHLAGSSSQHSHVLVEHADADGLFDELAKLADESGLSRTDMLALGSADGRHPHIRTIQEASARSVREALMAGFPPRERPVMDLATLRAALDGAMIENRYQPIVRLADRHPIGLEALARLNHPEMGTLLPDRFVPQIEDAGLAAELTDLVSARAFADMAGSWFAEHGIRMSVNFPLDVLLDYAALDRLEHHRAALGIPAERIIVELTESRPVEDFAMLRGSLDYLRGLGYGVAIDDVGPAVPCLAELLELPFTSLKLDKELVKYALGSEATHAFLALTIAQARQRGMTVVAEGVETPAIWNAMRALGVDEAQGFLVARPLPFAAVPIWSGAWVSQSQSLA